MKTLKNMCLFLAIMVMAFGFTSVSLETSASAKDKFKLAWSHYVTWDLTAYMRDSGLLDKWAKLKGITIEVTPPMDYVESYTQFAAGSNDAVTVTNMDALMTPAFGGVDSEAIVVQDYSNGNDDVVSYSGKVMADLKGRKIVLIVGTVSHHLLARCLEMNNMSLADVTLMNVASESEAQNYFMTNKDPATTVVTWNPIVMALRQEPNAVVICDSSKIPGEIMDMIVVRTDADERFKQALTGAYFEAIAQLGTKGASHTKVVAAASKSANCTPAEYEKQLTTTALFMSPKAAYDFLMAPGFKTLMETVQRVTFEAKMYTPKSKGEVGIQLPDGTIIGDKKNIKLRFPTKYVKMAMDGKL